MERNIFNAKAQSGERRKGKKQKENQPQIFLLFFSFTLSPLRLGIFASLR
jgi:hypothetical protein